MKDRNRLVSEIIKDIKRDMTDEEILNLLADSKVSVDVVKENGKAETFGQRAADRIAKFAGSWAFIFSFVGILVGGQLLGALPKLSGRLLQTGNKRIFLDISRRESAVEIVAKGDYGPG